MSKRFFNPALFALLCLVLLISQLSTPAYTQAQSQATPGQGKVVVPGPGESAAPGRPDLPQKQVLILYSEEKAHPAHELTDRGIRAVFQSNKLFDVQLYTEYLDLSRFRGPGHARAMADYLNRKYADTKIDVIITVYPAAIDFLMGEEGKVFPAVPIVACEIIRDTAENLDRSPWRRITTGVITGDNAASMLESALRLRPGTKGVALVAGTAPNDTYNEFLRALKPYAGKIELIDLTKLPMQETLARVGSLPPDTIVLYSSIFRDGAGQNFVPREALKLISGAANAPVFGLYDSYFGYGIVGGHLMSFEQQGREAATLALRIMGGESPAFIPFGGEQAYVNLYDWRELKRWGLDKSTLPADAVILNKPVSAWEMYKVYILGALAFCLLETALIIFLVVQRRRKKVAVEELNQFFHVSLDLKCIANTDGYFLRLNPAWERTLGYTPEELMVKRFLEFVHPDDLGRTREAVSTLASQQKVVSFENRYRCKDGTYRWLEWNSTPAGKLIYAAARDVTERKQAEAEVARARSELLRFERLSRLGELTASLAHELNQPLAAILSSTQAALRFLQSATPDLNLFRTILQNVVEDDKRAAGVIRSLRSMVKREEREKAPLNMNTVLDDVLNLFHSEAIVRNVTIERDFDTSFPPVLADKIQLEQVLLNLITNAAEAMSESPREHERRKIILRTQVTDHGIQVAVRDFGPGIDPAKLDDIWQPFFTTKSTGMGMGLSVSRSIIEAHGGRIWAENNPDGGATFFIELPVYESGK